MTYCSTHSCSQPIHQRWNSGNNFVEHALISSQHLAGSTEDRGNSERNVTASSWVKPKTNSSSKVLKLQSPRQQKARDYTQTQAHGTIETQTVPLGQFKQQVFETSSFRDSPASAWFVSHPKAFFVFFSCDHLLFLRWLSTTEKIMEINYWTLAQFRMPYYSSNFDIITMVWKLNSCLQYFFKKQQQ